MTEIENPTDQPGADFTPQDIEVLMKAVASGWNYMQSPNSYSQEEKAFVFKRLDEAHALMRSHPAGRDVA